MLNGRFYWKINFKYIWSRIYSSFLYNNFVSHTTRLLVILAKHVECPGLNILMCCGTWTDGSELWASSAKRKINLEVPAHCRCNEFPWDLPLYAYNKHRIGKEAERYTMEGLIRCSRRRTLYRGSSKVYLPTSFVDVCLCR